MFKRPRFPSIFVFALSASAQLPISIAINVISSTDIAPLGVPITFTARVFVAGCGVPTNVVFLDNGTIIPGSSSPLDSNRLAAINLSLPAGFHTVAAQSTNGCITTSPGVTVLVTTPGSYPSGATYAQQGPKLVPADESFPAAFGQSVAISGDGNTAVIGGPLDNNQAGAVWIYVRAGNTWVQQGPKLIGSGAVFEAGQGSYVAVSADGNTVIEGGSLENDAAWVFTRNNGLWSQQGSKLVPAGRILSAGATPVALSADGNTALVAAIDLSQWPYVFTRANGVWTEQAQLPPPQNGDAVGVAISGDGNTAVVSQGIGGTFVYTRVNGVWAVQTLQLLMSGGDTRGSVALSGNGDTLIVSAPPPGATPSPVGALVFTRTGGVWNPQPTQLTGAGATQGGFEAVALSSDGNTALVGSYGDGAAWLFQRSGGGWAQIGERLIGSGTVESPGCPAGGTCLPIFDTPQQGYSVALSADGSTALVGGPGDNQGTGAAWVFTSSGITNSPAPAPSPSSSVILTSSPPVPESGQPLILIATISTAEAQASPTGTIQFLHGTAVLGAAPVVAGQARLTVTLIPGATAISAIYSGDATYPAASATYQVSVYRFATALTITANSGTFTATVTPTQPTGQVQFYSGCVCGIFGAMIGKTLIGTADLADGTAKITVPTLPPGAAQVLAVYVGDNTWAPATSNILTIQ